MVDFSWYVSAINKNEENAKRYEASGNITDAIASYEKAKEVCLTIAKSETASESTRKMMLDKAERFDGKITELASQSNKIVERNDISPQEEKGKVWEGAKIPNVTFKDVAGLDDVKKTIMTRIINPRKYPEKYAEYGKKVGGAVLLYGPPGTGKTFIAKAIAGEVGATFYAIKGSDIMSKYVGESEKNIASLFEAAKKNDLSIIFIDEMDSLFGERGKDTHNDKRVNEFLQQMDGFTSKTDNLLVLGATNRPWDVDSAAVRSGRFSERIYVPLPDKGAREFLLKKNLKNIPLGDDIDFDLLVELTEGYSGADITEVCDRAKEEPLNIYINTNVKEPVSMKYLHDALNKVKPTVKAEDIKKFEEYASKK